MKLFLWPLWNKAVRIQFAKDMGNWIPLCLYFILHFIKPSFQIWVIYYNIFLGRKERAGMYFMFSLCFCVLICSSKREVWSNLLKCQKVLSLEGLISPIMITLLKKMWCFSTKLTEWKTETWGSFVSLPLANSVILIILPWNKNKPCT